MMLLEYSCRVHCVIAYQEVTQLLSERDPHPLHVFFTAVVGYTILSPVYKRYVDQLGLAGGEWVLDYGSGSGRIARHIARRLLTGGGHLTCVDIPSVWIDTARKRLKKYPNVDFKFGDIATLDIEDGAYDAVVIHFVLHHVDKNVRVEAERGRQTVYFGANPRTARRLRRRNQARDDCRRVPRTREQILEVANGEGVRRSLRKVDVIASLRLTVGRVFEVSDCPH